MNPQRPSLQDEAVAELSEVLGGPGGRHASNRAWAPLVVGLLIAAALVALGAGLRAGCESTGWSQDSSRFAPGCFSALPATYVASGGAEAQWPYGAKVGDTEAPRALGEPVVRYEADASHALVGATLVQAALADLAVDDAQVAARGEVPVEDLYRDPVVQQEAAQTVLLASIVLAAALLALVTVIALFREPDRQRRWDGVLVAAAPIVAVATLVDLRLVAVTLALAGVLCVRRRAYGLAGVLVGAAMSFSFTAWAIAVALGVVVALRGPVRQTATYLGALAAAWFLLALPALVTGVAVWRQGWGHVFDAAGEPGSVQSVIEVMAGRGVPQYTAVAVAVLVVWIGAVGVLTWVRRDWPPRVEQICLLVVAPAVALFGAGPAAALWVLPFVVLAHPRLWPLIGWQLLELSYAGVLWWTTDGDLVRSDSVVEGPLAAMTVLRVAALLGLTALVVRDVALPSHDLLADERRPQETSTRSNVVAV